MSTKMPPHEQKPSGIWTPVKLTLAVIACAAISVLTITSTQATVKPSASANSTPTPMPTPNIADTPLPTPAATPAAPQDVYIPGRLMYVKGSVIYMLHHYDLPVPIAVGRQPSISPDGKKLAYVTFAKNFQNLMTVDIQSRKPSLFLDDSLTDPQDARTGKTASMPAWSDDGKSIFFSWSYPGSPGYGGTNAPSPLPAPITQRTDLSVTECAAAGPCDAGTAKTLTAPYFETGGDYDAAPRLADPTYLVYSMWQYQTQARDNTSRSLASLQALNLTTGSQQALTQPLDNVSQPVWSPNGRYLAFVKTSDDLQSSSIWIMTFHPPGSLADYGKARLLVKGAPFVAHPVFSPDGKYIAFEQTSSDGRLHLDVAKMTFGPKARVDDTQEVKRTAGVNGDSVIDGDRLAWAP